MALEMLRGKEKSRADFKLLSANLKSLLPNWPNFVQFPKHLSRNIKL